MNIKSLVMSASLLCSLPAVALPQEGKASWYGPGFHGRQTASGEIFNTRDLTAAHKTYPFGTRVLVENLDSGLAITVRINDRGPFIKGRIIDLSQAAADHLRVHGISNVRIRKIP
jgi:rare lipoprotein A